MELRQHNHSQVSERCRVCSSRQEAWAALTVSWKPAQQLSYVAVRKHTRWGQAPSLRIYLNANPTMLDITESVCSVIQACVSLVRIKHSSVSSLPLQQQGITRTLLEAGFPLASSSLSRGGGIIPAGNWSVFRRPPGLLVTPSSLRGLASKILKVVS